jgi:hypothetical protein
MKRPGIALVAALSLLALLGLLVAGGVATMTAAQRAARSSLAELPLASAASLAVDEIVHNAPRYALAELPPGKPTRLVLQIDAPVLASADVTRLPNGVLWIMVDVRMSADTLEHRRVGIIARFPVAFSVPPAPLVFGGSATLDPDVNVAIDSTGEADCRVTTASASMQTSDSVVLYSTAAQRSAIDSAAGVVRVRGDTVISGGSIDGVMVVDGALSITGPVFITGLVIVNGTLISLQGLHLTGAMVVRGTGSHLSGASISYSPCTVSHVLRRSAPPRMVRGHGWLDVF